MSTDIAAQDRIPMNQRERDILTIMRPVLQGERTQVEAARLLGLSVRQVRRLQRKLHDQGDTALVHGLRGRPSNRRLDAALRRDVLQAYRQRYADFGPPLRLREAGSGRTSGQPRHAPTLAAGRGTVAASASP